MKVTYKNVAVDDFPAFYEYLHRKHVNIMGAEYDADAKTLTMNYQPSTSPLSRDALPLERQPVRVILQKVRTQARGNVDEFEVLHESNDTMIIVTRDKHKAIGKIVKDHPDFVEVER